MWTALYTMMAVAAWLVWKRSGFAAQVNLLAMFLAQLVLNAAWTPLFFRLHWPGVAFAEIVLLWLAIAATQLAALLPLNSREFRQDAVQSCRAAFTVRELQAIAQQAELDNFKITRNHWFFRMTLEGRK